MIRYIYVFFILLLSGVLHAQTYSITGRVIDQQSNPIPGVNIILLNTTIGTASDINGNYELKNLTPGIYGIEFSAIGFERQRRNRVVVSNSNVTLNIILKPQAIKTDEVIVTAGKYEQKKSDLPVSAEILYEVNYWKEISAILKMQ